MTTDPVPKIQVQRILVAIYPTRAERFVIRFVSWCYTHPEGSVLDRLGDRVDRLVVLSQRVRARLRSRR